jgi:hypothetical protein
MTNPNPVRCARIVAAFAAVSLTFGCSPSGPPGEKDVMEHYSGDKMKDVKIVRIGSKISERCRSVVPMGVTKSYEVAVKWTLLLGSCDSNNKFHVPGQSCGEKPYAEIGCFYADNHGNWASWPGNPFWTATDE